LHPFLAISPHPLCGNSLIQAKAGAKSEQCGDRANHASRAVSRDPAARQRAAHGRQPLPLVWH
jgi:hypothetical protein